MANIWEDRVFFGLPIGTVDGGHLSELSHSALKLWTVLNRLAQYSSAAAIELSGKELLELAGIRSAAAITAREQLKAIHWIDWKYGPHGVITYILLDQETGEPLPTPKRKDGKSYKGIRKTGSGPHVSRPKSPPPVAVESHSSVPLTWEELDTEKPPTQVFANQRAELAAGLRAAKPASSPSETGVFAERKLASQNENKTGELEEKCISESFSERGFSEPRVTVSKIPHKANVCNKCLQLSVSFYSDGTKRCDYCDSKKSAGAEISKVPVEAKVVTA